MGSDEWYNSTRRSLHPSLDCVSGWLVGWFGWSVVLVGRLVRSFGAVIIQTAVCSLLFVVGAASVPQSVYIL